MALYKRWSARLPTSRPSGGLCTSVATRAVGCPHVFYKIYVAIVRTFPAWAFSWNFRGIFIYSTRSHRFELRHIKGLRPLPPTPGREGEFTHTSLPEPTRKLYGYESKYKVWIKAPKLHTIHTPRSILWSIPCDIAWSIPLIHTLDPYPWSIPLSRWRKTDAGLNDAFYPNIYCFWFSYCYSHRYYRCFYCCLHCLRCCCRRHY